MIEFFSKPFIDTRKAVDVCNDGRRGKAADINLYITVEMERVQAPREKSD